MIFQVKISYRTSSRKNAAMLQSEYVVIGALSKDHAQRFAEGEDSQHPFSVLSKIGIEVEEKIYGNFVHGKLLIVS